MRDLKAWKNMTACAQGLIDVEGEVASLKIDNNHNINYIRHILIQNNDGELKLDGEITYLFSRTTLEKLVNKVKSGLDEFIHRCLKDDSNIFYLDII